MSGSTDQPGIVFSGDEACSWTASEAVRKLKQKEVSPAELLEISLARIDAVEPAVNATVTTCPERARDSLAALGTLAVENGNEAGWLAGLPLGIKDLTPVSGVRTTFGNLGMKDFVPEINDPLVEKIEQRGGVVVGKTNTPEFGAGGNTFNAVFGSTRNPWDTRMNAGGSSGGAAVSLATGEVWLSHGSDLAGSLRTPAALCGVVGLRPTPGRAGGGPAQIAFTLEGISGPMARNVEDIALFLDAMAGYDPQMPMSLDAPVISFQEAVGANPGNIRIAFAPDQNGFAPVEDNIRHVMRLAMDRLANAGMEIEEACPQLESLEHTYLTLRGILFGAVTGYLPQAVQQHFKQTLRENMEYGINQTSADIYEAFRNRTALYHQMRLFLQDHDVLVIPVVGIEPGPVEVEYPSHVAGEAVGDYVGWLRFSFLATATTLPAISIPCGFTESGMPVGLQLIGPPRGDARLLQVAKAIETVLEFPQTPIDPIIRH